MKAQEISRLHDAFIKEAVEGKISEDAFVRITHETLRSQSHEALRLLFKKADPDETNSLNWNSFIDFILLENLAVLLNREDASKVILQPVPQKTDARPFAHRGMMTRIVRVNQPKPMYVTCAPGALKLWDASKLTHDGTMPISTSSVGSQGMTTDLVHMPPDRVAVSTVDRIVKIFDVLLQAEVCSIASVTYDPTALEFCRGFEHLWTDEMEEDLQSRISILQDQQQEIAGGWYRHSQKKGLLCVGDSEGTVHVFWVKQIGTGKGEFFSMPLHGKWITQLMFISDFECLLSSSLDGMLKITNLRRQEVIRTLTLGLKADPILRFSFCPSQKLIAMCSKRITKVFNAFTMQLIASLGGDDDVLLEDIAFSGPDPQLVLVTVTADKIIRVWDVKTMMCCQLVKDKTHHAPENRISAVFLDIAAGQLVLGSSLLSMLRLASVQSRQEGSSVCGVAYSPIFSTVVAATTDLVSVFSPLTGERTFYFAPVADSVVLTGLSLGANGRSVAISANDGTVRIANFNSGQTMRLMHAASASQIAHPVAAKSIISKEWRGKRRGSQEASLVPSKRVTVGERLEKCQRRVLLPADEKRPSEEEGHKKNTEVACSLHFEVCQSLDGKSKTRYVISGLFSGNVFVCGDDDEHAAAPHSFSIAMPVQAEPIEDSTDIDIAPRTQPKPKSRARPSFREANRQPSLLEKGASFRFSPAGKPILESDAVDYRDRHGLVRNRSIVQQRTLISRREKVKKRKHFDAVSNLLLNPRFKPETQERPKVIFAASPRANCTPLKSPMTLTPASPVQSPNSRSFSRKSFANRRLTSRRSMRPPTVLKESVSWMPESLKKIYAEENERERQGKLKQQSRRTTSAELLCLEWCPPATVAVGMSNGYLSLWHVHSGCYLGSAVACIAPQAPPTISSSSSTGDVLRRHRGSQFGTVERLCYLKDPDVDGKPVSGGALLSVGSDGYLRIWKLLPKLQCVGKLHIGCVSLEPRYPGSSGIMGACRCSYGPTLSTLAVHRIEPKASIKVYEHKEIYHTAPDGRKVRSFAKERLRKREWVKAGQRMMEEMMESSTPSPCCEEEEEESVFVAVGDATGAIQVWRLERLLKSVREDLPAEDEDLEDLCDQISGWRCHSSEVTSLTFAMLQSDVYVISGGADGLLWLWHAKTGSPVGKFGVNCWVLRDRSTWCSLEDVQYSVPVRRGLKSTLCCRKWLQPVQDVESLSPGISARPGRRKKSSRRSSPIVTPRGASKEEDALLERVICSRMEARQASVPPPERVGGVRAGEKQLSLYKVVAVPGDAKTFRHHSLRMYKEEEHTSK